jgi:hypothetical protein
MAVASRVMLARREEISRAEGIGLTELYNRVDDGAYTDLVKLHRTLDEAVASCYGWLKSVAQNDDELVAALGLLNVIHAENPSAYEPF